MSEIGETSHAKPLLSTRARAVAWTAALVMLLVTFAAYDQFALALQWVVMKFC